MSKKTETKKSTKTETPETKKSTKTETPETRAVAMNAAFAEAVKGLSGTTNASTDAIARDPKVAKIISDAVKTAQGGGVSLLADSTLKDISAEHGENFIYNGNQALIEIASLAKKSIDQYLIFGGVWSVLRKKVNNNKQLLGHFRTKIFVDSEGKPLIDAYTASYSATLFENWEEIENFRDMYRPNLNNPRPLVQDWKKHKKALLEEKLEAKKQLESGKTKEQIEAEKKAESQIKLKKALAKAETPEAETPEAETPKTETPKTETTRFTVETRETPKSADDIVNAFAIAGNDVVAGINDGTLNMAHVSELDRLTSNVKRAITRFYADEKAIDEKIKESKAK